jgi:flagellar protein FliO/FliZ
VTTWDFISILGSRVITGTKSLHLVEVGGQIFLVGSANDSINLVAEIADKEAKDSIRLSAAQGGMSKPRRFVETLAAMFKPKVKRQLEINESIDFMKSQRDRLKKMKE